MLLYVCTRCGRWQDQSLTVAIGRAFTTLSRALSGSVIETPLIPECLDGHGPMTLVQPRDKLFVWSEGDERALSPSGLRLVEHEEITLTDKDTGIAMTIQPGVSDSTRQALIDAFTRSDEEADDHPKTTR